MSEYRVSSPQEVAPPLTIRDRVNYPYLIANAILTFQKQLQNLQFTEREVKESIIGFMTMIPSSWKDEEWIKELNEAVIIDKMDVRPTFCGVKPTVEICERLNVPISRDVKTFDYYKVFHCCINLLDRRGLTSRKHRTEIMLGKKATRGAVPNITEADTEEF